MNLDTIDLQSVDPSGMYDKIYNFPEQLEEAMTIGQAIEPDLTYYKNIQNITVAGMGGSAIGGDLVRSWLADKLNIPFHICRNYRLPNFINSNSLVIASSYSGNTEETLSAFQDAVDRKAKIFCLTTGGKLGELAEKQGLCVAGLPEGYPPRSALGFSVVPLLYFLQKIGFIENVENDISEVVLGLKNYRKIYALESPAANNPAKALAAKLHSRLPIIYSGPELTDVVGTRWKGQLCENAESLAFNNVFPEFNHNELVGFNKIDSYRGLLVVVILRDVNDHERVKARMAVVKNLLNKLGIEVVDVISQGDFPLGRLFSLIQIGDFASFYLAVLNEVDPTPVKAIDYLKVELSK